jgi:predicted dehydrogenase/threonine dehydrogenase-like Zn-dependent dehydrogenase
LVKKAIERARNEGVAAAVAAARSRLQPSGAGRLLPLGYSSAGTVVELDAVPGLAVGDRVACGGVGWANHAELVAVPKHLVARLPDDVSSEAGAYATVGAIALHAVRQGNCNVGERVGVVGLGLVGQLAVRLLSAGGCAPFGIDLLPEAVELARSAGGDGAVRSDPDLGNRVQEFTRGLGLDALLICASGGSPDLLELAATLARDRGRIVVVGDVAVNAPRALLYNKELEIVLARSYGPGRYDVDYEERGVDLPAGYVRWTEQRNLQAFVDLVGAGKLDPAQLTTHRFPLEAAADAYSVLVNGDDGRRPVGIVLEYPSAPRETYATPAPARAVTGTPRVGVVGSGSFAQAVLIPALAAEGAALVAAATEGGLTAADAARRFGFGRAVTPDELAAAPDVDAIVVATRHDSHARLTVDALRAGKAVYVEKPPALTADELAAVASAARDANGLMVGFNRRCAPLVERLLEELPETADTTIVIRVNAGALPDTHWLHDLEAGGGRLIGEGCHFVDLATQLGRSPAARVHAFAVPQPTRTVRASDSIVATLQLRNGAVASIVYTGGGNAKLPKERVEVFAGGLAAVIDDFSRLEVHAPGRRSHDVRTKQDKGHRASVARFLAAVRSGAAFPPLEGYVNTMHATFGLAESLETGLPVDIR